jgi:hypothetical protein
MSLLLDPMLSDRDTTFIQGYNPLFQGGQAAFMGSILMSKREELDHFEVAANLEALLYDDAVECLKDLCKGMDLKGI